MRGRLILLASAALLTACFDEPTPPRGIQIGGTEYNMNLSLPAPIRVPTATAAVSFRTVTGVQIVDSIVVNATFLKELAAPARYQFYVVNGLTGAAWPVSHIARFTRTDTAFSNGGTTTSTTVTNRASAPFFTGAKFNTALRLRVANGTGADTIGQSGGFLVLTIQSDSTTPSYGPTTPKMLWFRFRNQTTNAVVAAPAGSFGSLRNISDSSRYVAQGSGRSAFWDRNRDGVLHLSAIVVGLPQPPVGYYYQPYARDSRTGAGARFGELTDKYTNASLMEADLRPTQGTLVQLPDARFGVVDDELACTFGTCASARFTAFTEVQLVLEPKTGDPSYPNVTVALQGPIPKLLTDRRTQDGIVQVTVTRTGTGAPVFLATVALYGPGTNALLQSRATDADGVVTFGSVPAGPVDVVVYPPSTLVAPKVEQRTTVIARDTVKLAMQL